MTGVPTAPIPLGPATTLTTYHGKPVDLVTKQSIQQAEILLGFELTLLQGYNPDNFATSAGTHKYGVVDFAPLRAVDKLEVLAGLGWFIWRRAEVDGLWQEHLHGGIRNHPGLAEIAAAQQRDFDGTPPRSGLKGHVVDPSVLAYRPKKPAQFVYDPKWSPNMPEPTKVQEARNRITEAAVACGDAIVALRQADKSREAARRERPALRQHKQGLEAMLERMPPK